LSSNPSTGKKKKKKRKEHQQELEDLGILIQECPAAWWNPNTTVCVCFIFGSRKVWEAASGWTAETTAQ
jgi:hypothetical protein